ncbi:hypothetical protein PFLUV_G00226910 [Perca fluviatilis]|uniref:Uncharacterized protein n=1 Tax=Perca fluviatilis TaxID=8168 RepID=A0A6A5E653_PERFL|nr:hypothetical protein PFLUV_G00226910 [Perca fluviatilis]
MPHRLCSVEIKNNSASYTLANPRVFTESGHCEFPLPPMVGPYSPASALFNKHMGSATFSTPTSTTTTTSLPSCSPCPTTETSTPTGLLWGSLTEDTTVTTIFMI